MHEFPLTIRGAGGIVYGVVVFLLVAGTPLAIGDAVFLPVLLVALPALGVAQLPVASVEPLPPKRAVYALSAVTTLVLAVSALAMGARHGGTGAVGLRTTAFVTLASWTAGLIVTGLAIIAFSRVLAGRLGFRESRLLRHLLPEGAREKGLFVALSISAGFGEETAYRGYAIPILFQATGSLWASVAISSMAFGIVHAYQGIVGVVRSAVLGCMLALPVALAGNLWPAILAHVTLDVLAGVVLGRWLAGLDDALTC